jgi:PPP family 3-phenylpropionic acid transporter
LGVLTPYLGIFLDGRGFTSVQIGELFAVITLTRIIGPVLWASVADKYGKGLTILRLGSLLTVLCFAGVFWVDGFWPLTLVFGLMMMFWTGILPQLEVITMQTVQGNASGYGRIRLWGSVGFIVLAVSVGYALDHFSTETPVYASMMVLTGLFFSTLLLVQPQPVQTQESYSGSISSLFLSRVFILFLVGNALLQVSFGAYYGFFALYLRDLDYTGQQTGWLIALGVIAEIGIFLVARKLIVYFGVKPLLVFCLVMTCLRWYALAAFAHVFWIVLITQLIHALSFGLTHSVSVHFIHHFFPAKFQSRGQAAYISIAFGIGGAIGNYSAGHLWAQGSGAYATFAVAAVMAMLGAIAILFIPKKAMVTG